MLHGRHFDPQDLNEFNNTRLIDFYLKNVDIKRKVILQWQVRDWVLSNWSSMYERELTMQYMVMCKWLQNNWQMSFNAPYILPNSYFMKININWTYKHINKNDWINNNTDVFWVCKLRPCTNHVYNTEWYNDIKSTIWYGF